jgi:Cft2 family RNA processing exonuclease
VTAHSLVASPKPTLPTIPAPQSVKPALSESGLALVPVERLERFLEALARLDGRHGEVAE